MDIFEEEKRDAATLGNFVLKNRKVLIGGLLIGLLLGFVFYNLMPEKYRSTGIVYPANTYGRDQVIANPQFGHELDAEHLMQLLESRSMRDSVVKRFDLITYYEIDSSAQGWEDQLVLSFISDVEFTKSRYLSIVIAATTKDPELSANIVNYIIETVNRYKAKIFKGNIEEELAYMKAQLDQQSSRLKETETSIYAVKDSSITENIIENYLIKISKDQYYPSDFLTTPQMAKLLDDYRIQKQKYLDLNKDYLGALEMAERPVLKNYVIDRAVPNYRPTEPSLVSSVALGGFFGGLISALIIGLLGIIKLKK